MECARHEADAKCGFRPRLPGSSDTLGIGCPILGKRSEGTVLCASRPHVTARFGQTSSPDRPRGNWSRIKHIPRVKRGQFLGVAYTPSTEKGPKRQVGERFQKLKPRDWRGASGNAGRGGLWDGGRVVSPERIENEPSFPSAFSPDRFHRPPLSGLGLAHGCAAARRFPAC